LLIGGIARSGNHLLRALLDGCPWLVVPPDEDFFARTLARSRRHQWQAWWCRRANVAPLFRKLQKNGFFERLNAGDSENSPGRTQLLDLNKYYARAGQAFRRFSLWRVCEAHFLGLREAVRIDYTTDDPLRVSACPLDPWDDDVTKLCALLTRFYTVKVLVIYRDPTATFASGKVRNYFGGIDRFAEAIDRFPAQIRSVVGRGDVTLLAIAYEDLVRETESVMRSVAEFIGIRFEPLLVRCTQNGEAVASNSSFLPTETVDRARADAPAESTGACILTADEIERLAGRGERFLCSMRELAGHRAQTTDRVET